LKRETRRAIRDLAFYSSLGFSVALSIFIGLGLGYWLDNKFGTHPWFLFIGLGLGIIAGFRNIGLAIKKTKETDTRK
jgi:ATP synthase protein I